MWWCYLHVLITLMFRQINENGCGCQTKWVGWCFENLRPFNSSVIFIEMYVSLVWIFVDFIEIYWFESFPNLMHKKKVRLCFFLARLDTWICTAFIVYSNQQPGTNLKCPLFLDLRVSFVRNCGDSKSRVFVFELHQLLKWRLPVDEFCCQALHDN